MMSCVASYNSRTLHRNIHRSILPEQTILWQRGDHMTCLGHRPQKEPKPSQQCRAQIDSTDFNVPGNVIRTLIEHIQFHLDRQGSQEVLEYWLGLVSK